MSNTDTDALVPASDPLQKFRGAQSFLESCWRQANANIGVDRDDVALAIRTLQSALDEAASAIERLTRERSEAMARVEEAFREGYCSRATYNDKDVSDIDTEWALARDALCSIRQEPKA